MATIKLDAQSTPGIFKIDIDQEVQLEASLTATGFKVELTDTMAGILAALINEVFAARKVRGDQIIINNPWLVKGETGNREAVAE